MNSKPQKSRGVDHNQRYAAAADRPANGGHQPLERVTG